LTESVRIQLDATGGIAGDMFAAAIVDAKPELQARVLADSAAVLPPSVGQPAFEEGLSGGLRCLRFRLRESVQTHHRHDGDTRYEALADRIARAELSPGTAEHALAILRLLAEAEAAIHAVPLADVHFHEIADWDSIMDVVAAGSIAASFAAASWSVSPLPRGGGLVQTQHGLLPVPAPATAKLLEGFVWHDDGIEGERVTPTGAAILRHLVKFPGSSAAGVMGPSGIGAGTRELRHVPNILRVSFFTEARMRSADEVSVISFDVDDMTGEEVALAAERLRQMEGVLDLILIPALGKKGRPVQIFRLLAMPEHQTRIGEACLSETSTLGLRWQRESRLITPRAVTRDTRSGLRVKTALRPAGPSRKVEHDDLQDIEGLDRRRAAGRFAETMPGEPE
jgi:hypothetical protein